MSTPENTNGSGRLRRASQVFSEHLKSRQGKLPDLNQLIEQHPDLAEQIRALAETFEAGQSISSPMIHRELGETIDTPSSKMSADMTIDFDETNEIRPNASTGDGSVHATLDSVPSGNSESLAQTPKGISTPNDVDRYEVMAEFAHGGMGVIYRVLDRKLNRTLAMKVMRPGGGGSAGSRDATQIQLSRFNEEARVTAQLDHPGIVPVHEMGINEAGEPFFLMKLVRGSDLSEIFQHARDETDGWNMPRAITAMIKACQAIAYAHSKDVIHRDLKPANVMAGRFGEVYVMDWGLAKIVGKDDIHDIRPRPDQSQTFIVTDRRDDGSGESPLHTMDGSIVGTPAYMPPEQAAGNIDDVDHTSDIYSLGAILYNLVTGVAPHCDGDQRLSPQAILVKVLDKSPTPIPNLTRSAPAELVAIIQKAMAREKTERYETAEALAEDLQAYLDGRVVSAHKSGAFAEFRSWIRRNKGWAATLATAMALVLCGLAAFGISQRNARRAIGREHYFGSVMAARQYYENGQTDRAQEMLLQTDPEHRNWEWGRLLYQCNQSLLTFDATENDSQLNSMDLNADGTRLHTRGNDRISKLWDVTTGELLMQTDVKKFRTELGIFNTDGTVLALTTLGGRISLWNAETGIGLPSPKQQYNGIVQIGFHSQRNWLVVVTPRRVDVWDIDANERKYKISYILDTALRAVFSPDGSRLVIYGAINSTIYNAENGKIEFAAKIPRRFYTPYGVSPKGDRFAYFDTNGDLVITDTKTGDETRRIVRGESRKLSPSAAFRPDGEYLGVKYGDGSIEAWNHETGEKVFQFNHRVLDTDYGGNFEFIASTTGEQTINLWRPEESEAFRKLRGHTEIVDEIEVSSDGTRVVSSDIHGVVKVWATDFRSELIPHDVGSTGAALSNDGTRIATGHWDGEVSIWDTAGHKLVSNQELFRAAWALEFSPDDQIVAAAGTDGTIALILAENGRVAEKIDTERGIVSGVAFSADGEYLAASTFDGTFGVWKITRSGDNIGQAERVAWKKGSEAGYGNIGFHPNGRDIAVVAFDGKLQVWDWKSTTKRAETQAHDQVAMALAYSPDGSQIASGSNDHTLRIYDSELKEQLHKLQATASVFSIAFSPDGSRVMGACAENQALIGRPAVTMWDTASGKEVFSSIGEGGLIRASRFTRDGTRFITGNPAVTLDGVFAPGETETFNSFPTDPRAYGGTITHDSIAAYAKNYWQERVALSAKSVEPQIVNRDQRAWPPRDPATPADAIDLTPHYNAKLDVDWIIDLQFNQGANANDLATLPQGLVYLGNVPFDVRGVIQTRTRKLSDHFPTEVNGIAVGRKAQRIHVLHATMYKPTNNARIAYYYINYANGTRDQMPIVYGRDIMDWHHIPGQQFEADKATVAWTGTNEQTKASGRTLRLFKSVITPRQPDEIIESIDFVSTKTDSSPFLIAATIDRNEDPMAMYLESNSRAVTNYTSNRDSREFKSELIASWKHLAAEATREQPANRELAKSYTQLAIELETSLRDTIQSVATNPFSTDRITNALADRQWRYWDKGGLPADNWHQPDYDDSSWPMGDAPLGYGEPTGLATEVGFGGKAGKKHATTFFRKTFTIENSRQLYRISVSVDDGAAVYLNGNRIATINMPKEFDHTSLARKINPEPITPEAYWIPASKLNPAENTLAIEVHQASRTSSDITCDVKLEAIDTTVDYEGIEATLRKNNRSLPPGLRDR